MADKKKDNAPVALDELLSMLTRLKLTAIRDQLDSLLDQASRAELNLREALGMLCSAEVARKDERRVQMGMSIAKFPFVRTLEAFDYDAQPSVDPKQIRELATSRWVANGDSLLLLGPPGVGKTHLAVSLGREAILRGYSTLFVPATGLVTALARTPVLPARQSSLRTWIDPRHQQPLGRRMGQRVRRRRRGNRDPGSPAASQSRDHDPRRQLPSTFEAPRRPG